jgi:hypothetical protein
MAKKKQSASVTSPIAVGPVNVSPHGPLYRVCGQAIALVASGALFDRVSIVASKDRYVVAIEQVRFVGTPNRGWVYSNLGGPIAEQMHTGVWNLDPDDRGVASFARYLAKLPLGEPEKATGRAWAALCTIEETAELLWDKWWYVERLARQVSDDRAVERTRVAQILQETPGGIRRPLVPQATEVLGELEILLQQNHGLDLGDWRRCPRSSPMPPATLEPRRSGTVTARRRRPPSGT